MLGGSPNGLTVIGRFLHTQAQDATENKNIKTSLQIVQTNAVCFADVKDPSIISKDKFLIICQKVDTDVLLSQVSDLIRAVPKDMQFEHRYRNVETVRQCRFISITDTTEYRPRSRILILKTKVRQCCDLPDSFCVRVGPGQTPFLPL